MSDHGKGGKHAFIDQHKTEVISSGVFLVDLSECRGQVKTTKEESDWDSLSSGWGAVHDLPLVNIQSGNLAAHN